MVEVSGWLPDWKLWFFPEVSFWNGIDSIQRLLFQLWIHLGPWLQSLFFWFPSQQRGGWSKFTLRMENSTACVSTKLCSSCDPSLSKQLSVCSLALRGRLQQRTMILAQKNAIINTKTESEKITKTTWQEEWPEKKQEQKKTQKKQIKPRCSSVFCFVLFVFVSFLVFGFLVCFFFCLLCFF